MFNVDDRTSQNTFFNKESDWSAEDWDRSDACRIMNTCPTPGVIFIKDPSYRKRYLSDDDELIVNGKVIGCLHRITNDERIIACQYWWDNLPEKEKQVIFSLPNFDKAIFTKCTSIDVE